MKLLTFGVIQPSIMSDHIPQREPSPPAATSNPIERSLNAASQVGAGTPYFKLTKTLTYSYIFVLPLIILYELGISLINSGSVSQIRIGADILVKRFLNFVGLEGTLWLSALLVAVGVAIIIYERRLRTPIRPRYFLYMFGESMAYGIVIGMAVATFVTQLFSLTWPPTLQIAGQTSLLQGLILSLGAGVYEELVFRLILVSALVGVMRFIPIGDKARYIVAALVGALIFSGVHYIGELGDPFDLASFTFRFLMGLALNALYLTRGFGIAAMTHALYDVLVTLVQR